MCVCVMYMCIRCAYACSQLLVLYMCHCRVMLSAVCAVESYRFRINAFGSEAGREDLYNQRHHDQQSHNEKCKHHLQNITHVHVHKTYILHDTRVRAHGQKKPHSSSCTFNLIFISSSNKYARVYVQLGHQKRDANENCSTLFL